jgi:Flp pilus assembly protein TadG
MFKAFFGFIAFLFFLAVLLVLLAGGWILGTIRKLRKAAEQAADAQAQRYREETGRRRRQYSQRTGNSHTADGQTSYTSSDDEDFFTEAKTTRTDTGETIIDHRHQHRNDRKIFDDTDGEYVDFVEER